MHGKEAFFNTEYAWHTEQSLKMHQRNSFVQNLTRLWLEILSITGLAILFIGMVLQGKSVGQILPVLALFGAVSFRLMPSVSRIVSSLNLLRFGTAITDIIESEFGAIRQPISVNDNLKIKMHQYEALQSEIEQLRKEINSEKGLPTKHEK